MISAVRTFLMISSSLNAERCGFGRIRSNGIIIVDDQVRSTQVNEIVVSVGVAVPPFTNRVEITSRILKSVRCSRSFIPINLHDIPSARGSPQSPIQNGLLLENSGDYR